MVLGGLTTGLVPYAALLPGKDVDQLPAESAEQVPET